jgi:hypothetical protein
MDVILPTCLVSSMENSKLAILVANESRLLALVILPRALAVVLTMLLAFARPPPTFSPSSPVLYKTVTSLIYKVSYEDPRIDASYPLMLPSAVATAVQAMCSGAGVPLVILTLPVPSPTSSTSISPSSNVTNGAHNSQ